MAEKETWKNATKGRVTVIKFDHKDEIYHEMVSSGRNVFLTPEERRANQDAAAMEDMDIFYNGTMIPVRIVETEEDAKEIASNPNLKSEEDLRKMFGLQWKKFETEVATISNVTTLHRLKEIAQEGDATVRQVNVIEDRIAEVDPDASVRDVTIQNYGSVSPADLKMPTR